MDNPYLPVDLSTAGVSRSNPRVEHRRSIPGVMLGGFIGTSLAGGFFGILGGPIGIVVGTVLAAVFALLPFVVLAFVVIVVGEMNRLPIYCGVCGAIAGATSLFLLSPSLLMIVTAALGFVGGWLGARSVVLAT